jgi:predicted dehydrogenase
VSVSCDAYNPSWSWYAGHAAAEATFAFTNGTRFSFSGSWCAPGAETSWNGSWRVSGALGTALWDGDGPPAAELADGTVLSPVVGDEPEEIAGSLAEFVHCLRTGERPDSAADRNILSLAMVEGAVRSAAEHRIVRIEEIMTAAQPAELVR